VADGPLYLGVDVSTTGVKALLVDAHGRVVASASQPHPSSAPQPLWSEQAPQDWITGAVGAIREAVRQIDPNLPLMGMSNQVEVVEKKLQPERVFAQAYALFGALALLLASVGLFGLMSYSVARRTNEIGIRMALGAQRGDVLRLVMGESMTLVVAGVAIGLTAAIAAGRLVATLLYGLAATDAPTMIAGVIVLIVVSAIAGYLPARRAARVDPLVALHYE